MSEEQAMYERYVGKRVQITMLKDGNEDVWQPQKVLEFNDGILLLANGSEVDTKSDVFVGLTAEQKDRCEICKFYETSERKNRGLCNNPTMLQQKENGAFILTSGFPCVSPDHWCGNFIKSQGEQNE